MGVWVVLRVRGGVGLAVVDQCAGGHRRSCAVAERAENSVIETKRAGPPRIGPVRPTGGIRNVFAQSVSDDREHPSAVRIPGKKCGQAGVDNCLQLRQVHFMDGHPVTVGPSNFQRVDMTTISYHTDREMLTAEKVHDMTGVPVSTLHDWAAKRERGIDAPGPHHIRLSNRHRRMDTPRRRPMDRTPHESDPQPPRGYLVTCPCGLAS